MVIDIAKNPRIAQLLGRIEETRRLLQESPPSSRAALQAEIDGVYAEVGRYTHWLARQDPHALGRLLAEGEAWAAQLDARLGLEPMEPVPIEEVHIEELVDDDVQELSVTELPRVELTMGSGAIDVRELVDIDAADEATDVTHGMFAPVEDDDDQVPEPLAAPLEADEAPTIVREIPDDLRKAVAQLRNARQPSPSPGPVASPASAEGRVSASAETSQGVRVAVRTARPAPAPAAAPAPPRAPAPSPPRASLPDLGATPDITDAAPLAFEDDSVSQSISDASPLAMAHDDDLEYVYDDEDDDLLYDDGYDEVGEVAIAVRTGSFEVPNEAARVPAEADVTPAVQQDDPWLRRLQDLLSVLGRPADIPSGDDAFDTLVRTLVLATTNLELKWTVYPTAVQQALLGLVGARARRLEQHRPGDADVRLAVSRMRRYCVDRELLVVPSLRERVPPERDWSADERRYWAVLHAGM